MDSGNVTSLVSPALWRIYVDSIGSTIDVDESDLTLAKVAIVAVEVR